MACPGNSGGTGALQILDPSKVGLPQTCADQSTLNTIMSDVFIVLGAVALFMIVLSGFNYVNARGQPEAVEKAKNRLVYAIVGLVLAASAYGIINVFLQRTS